MKKQGLMAWMALAVIFFCTGSGMAAMIELAEGKAVYSFDDVQSAFAWREKQCPLHQMAFDTDARVMARGSEKPVAIDAVFFVEKKNDAGVSEFFPFASKAQADDFSRQYGAVMVSQEDLAARVW